VRKLDFYKLGREKQERFLASTKGSAPPAPIVHAKGDGGRTIRWGILCGAAVIVLLVLFLTRYGILGAPLAVHGGSFLPIYAGLFFVIPYAALRAVGSAMAAKGLPYKPGVYVFPMCLVDARDKVLRVYSMTEIARFDKAAGAGSTLRLAFKGGGSFSFPAGDVHDAAQLNSSFDIAKQQVEHALKNNDDGELVTLDPFYEAKRGWTSPIGPTEALSDRSPVYKRFDYAIAAVCALVLGPTLWGLHNKSSDDSMFAKAMAANTPDAFVAYTSVGKRHVEEVDTVLLPRAQLERAKSEMTVEAIQGFIASHPNSAIQKEADDALREALLRELDKAKKGASLASLGAFTKKYPAHHLDAEYARAVHDLYQGAVARFKARPANDSPQLAAFVQSLATWLEKHGTTVTVVFHREVSTALGQADKLIGAAPTNRAFGPKQVTKYFEPTTPQPKEAEVVSALQKDLREIFSPDLIDFKLGPEVDDAAQADLATKQPLVAVRYRFGWLGVAYGSPQLKRAFAGIHVSGEAAFSVPNVDPLRIKIEVGPPRGLQLQYAATHAGLSVEPLAEGAEPEPVVYQVMDLRALDHITTLIENAIVKPAAPSK
jgi:hypothetical protein